MHVATPTCLDLSSFKQSEYVGKFFKHILTAHNRKKLDFDFSLAATKRSNSLLCFLCCSRSSLSSACYDDILAFISGWFSWILQLLLLSNGLDLQVVFVWPLWGHLLQILPWMAANGVNSSCSAFNFCNSPEALVICTSRTSKFSFISFLFLSSGVFSWLPAVKDSVVSQGVVAIVARSFCNCLRWNVQQQEQIWQ